MAMGLPPTRGERVEIAGGRWTGDEDDHRFLPYVDLAAERQEPTFAGGEQEERRRSRDGAAHRARSKTDGSSRSTSRPVAADMARAKSARLADRCDVLLGECAKTGEEERRSPARWRSRRSSVTAGSTEASESPRHEIGRPALADRARLRRERGPAHPQALVLGPAGETASPNHWRAVASASTESAGPPPASEPCGCSTIPGAANAAGTAASTWASRG